MSNRQGKVFTEAERAGLIAAGREWKGSQAEFARAHGISQTTASRWLRAGVEVRGSDRARPKVVAGKVTAPTMLEVVRPRAASATVIEPESVTARLVLGRGVALVLEALPPPSWVAQLAAELDRC